jgi:hypothetical protein
MNFAYAMAARLAVAVMPGASAATWHFGANTTAARKGVVPDAVTTQTAAAPVALAHAKKIFEKGRHPQPPTVNKIN